VRPRLHARTAHRSNPPQHLEFKWNYAIVPTVHTPYDYRQMPIDFSFLILEKVRPTWVGHDATERRAAPHPPKEKSP